MSIDQSGEQQQTEGRNSGYACHEELAAAVQCALRHSATKNARPAEHVRFPVAPLPLSPLSVWSLQGHPLQHVLWPKIKPERTEERGKGMLGPMWQVAIAYSSVVQVLWYGSLLGQHC